MAYSASDLEGFRDALLKARFNGLRTVEYDGQSVTYRSDAELERALGDVERRLAKAQGTGPTRQVRVSTSKGL
ncbi:hypothetical protein [uncultured Albimonas sp.]|uniref:phage head-tail joining protein n=1 Tax=uncultured Albimonas sp. TaxID=1331701 RepID=UPI0030ECAB14|tara:strand:- start:1412 stop:1630 length:219 start_codon:yes stop_codon:yes gene_type:complete